jgi:hypothetical protein
VITHGLKRIGQILKDPATIVKDHGGFAMHNRISPDHLCTIRWAMA